MGFLIYFIGILSSLCMSVFCVLPQVSQEGLLRPFRSYADVTLFHYYLPKEVSRATFQFAAFMDNPKCPVRNVFIHFQHGSYPVMAPDNASFPDRLVVERESMQVIWLNSSFVPHDPVIHPVYNPLPGSWFAAAYLPDWDQHVQQEGLGHKCQYSLGSIALWSQINSIESIPLEKAMRFTSQEHFTYYKFYIPSGIFSFTIRVDDCHFHTLRRFYENNEVNPNGGRTTTTENGNDELFYKRACIKNVFIRGRALPLFSSQITNNSLYDENSNFTQTEIFPFTDSYYYILIAAESRVSYNVTIDIIECPLQLLGKTFIQHFSGVNAVANMKEQAVDLNYATIKKSKKFLNDSSRALFNCNCVPIYRLTRIKHSQDFSDTFLLEGKEWFTTWLKLSDQMPVGASFEILPFVDIGGTLNVGLHLDELIMNSTTQEIRVDACIRKSRVPKTICCNSSDNSSSSSCCDSKLSLAVSSKDLQSVDDYLLIPFPEPDIWFVSYTLSCHFNGEKVPCAPEGILISIDIRTQPCVLTKPKKSGGKILPCGQFGICQEVHRGQFFYTSCKCIGGYRGWACTDDSKATPNYIIWLNVFLLTLSNLFFIPAIFLAFKREHFTHVLVYFSTMISSAFYHACDQELYGFCLTRYVVLQFCDFFCSILALWVTLISLATSSAKYDSVFYILGAIIIAILVEYNRTGLLVLAVPFILGMTIPISFWAYRSYLNRSILIPKMNRVLLFLPGVFLGATGLLLYVFVETEENYRYTHSAWHIIIALSLVYLLPKKKNFKTPAGDGATEPTLPSSSTATSNLQQIVNIDSADVGISHNKIKTSKTPPSESSEISDENSSELNHLRIGNENGNDLPSSISQSNSSPIFFISSDLDHLVQQDDTR